MSIFERFGKWWLERIIRQTIASHGQRNRQLRQVLLQYGVDLDAPRAIDLHFWATGEDTAGRLREALNQRGYRVSIARPARGEDASGLWNVEAAVQQAPTLTLSEPFTEEMVRLAVEAGGKFDGWGTAIEEAATPAPE